MTGHVASHRDWGEDAYPYPQPYVYLQMHWVEMHVLGWRDVDFDTIAAVSGASALFGYEHGTWRPKYANLLDQIMAFLRSGQPAVDPEETVETIRFIEAANESRTTGKSVTL